MSGRPKNQIMSPDEMRVIETRRGRLYSQTSDHGLVVSDIIAHLAEELAEMPQKINLKDLEMVKKVAVSYTAACAENGTIANKTGLCRAMGVTRQAVDWFMNHNPDEPSAEYLMMIFDAYAEALSAASLAGATHPIVSIFLLKAISGYRDTVSLEAAPARDPLGDRVKAETIAARYKDLCDLLPAD